MGNAEVISHIARRDDAEHRSFGRPLSTKTELISVATFQHAAIARKRSPPDGARMYPTDELDEPLYEWALAHFQQNLVDFSDPPGDILLHSSERADTFRTRVNWMN